MKLRQTTVLFLSLRYTKIVFLRNTRPDEIVDEAGQVTAVERMWHIQDSHNQIMAFTWSPNYLECFFWVVLFSLGGGLPVGAGAAWQYRRRGTLLWKKCGTYKTVKARLWPWLQAQIAQNVLRCSFFARRWVTSRWQDQHNNVLRPPAFLGWWLGPGGGAFDQLVKSSTKRSRRGMTVETAVKRIWHIQDSHNQIMALTLSPNDLFFFNLFSFRREAGYQLVRSSTKWGN